jgi:hypothetical protein
MDRAFGSQGTYDRSFTEARLAVPGGAEPAAALLAVLARRCFDWCCASFLIGLALSDVKTNPYRRPS